MPAHYLQQHLSFRGSQAGNGSGKLSHWLCGFLGNQALQQLKEKLPIERARMRLRLQIPVTCRNDLMQLLASQQATIESEDLALHNSQVGQLRMSTCLFIKHVFI